MKPPTIIDEPYGLVEMRVIEERYGIIELDHTAYELGSHRRVVKPGSISTPVPHVIPTDWHSFASRWNTVAPGIWTQEYLNSGLRLTRSWVASSIGEVAFGIDYSGVYSRAVNGLLLDLKAQDIAPLVSLGELKETSQFFEQAARGMLKSARKIKPLLSKREWAEFASKGLTSVRQSLKQAESKDVVKRLERVADAQLTYSYAVKPLLSDLHGSMEALYDARNNAQLGRVSLVKRAREKDKRRVVAFQTPSLSYAYWEVDETVGCTAKATWVLDDPFLVELSQLGLTDPLANLWDLGLATFVIDWGLPVGDFLSARTAQHGWRLEHGFVSVLQKMEAGVSAGYFERSHEGFREYGRWDPIKAEGVRFWRFVQTSSSLQAVPPVFKNPLSASHVANGSALFAKLLSFLNAR